MQLEARNVPGKQYCASDLQQHLIICTEDVTTLLHDGRCKDYIFLRTRLRLPRRVTLERVPTDWYFLLSACGVDMLPPRPSPLQLDIVCVFFPFILDIKFVGRTSRGHTGGRSHRIFQPPSFCGTCLNFSREEDSAIPFPRRS